ncbi:MAG: FixH family protein [Sulfurimonas sp.]|nr:FixH family protein [Sulfurimonas sp.]
MKFNSAKVWPYAIGFSILLVFCFCVATIMIAMTLPVEKSDKHMMDYHYVDAKINELIIAKIAFDKKYKVEYLTDDLSQDAAIIKYKVTDLENNPMNDAKIKVIITRPNNHKHDQELLNPRVNNGIYTFTAVTLAKPGRWNIMAKINISDVQSFHNVKADTRAKEAFEY